MGTVDVVGLRWFGSQEAVESAAEPATTVAPVDLAALVAEYSGVLYRVAYSVLRSEAEAEDAVQDCFLRVVQHQNQLATVRETRTWLIRIVWNLALDRRSRIRPEQMDETVLAGLLAKGIPADQRISEARRIAEVFTAIDKLSQREREVLLLSAVEELSTVEIAAVVGRSESTVRSLLFRARAHLRERLAREEVRREGGLR